MQMSLLKAKLFEQAACYCMKINEIDAMT